MRLEKRTDTSLAPPDGWKEDEEETEKAIINRFFNKKVPAALKEREVSDPGFKSKGCSASLCLEYAKFLMQGMPISTVAAQGDNSYTLICPGRDRIIQFRTTEVNTKIFSEAKLVFGELLVPRIARHCEFVLPVYTYNVLPGQLHVRQYVPRDSFPIEREKRTVMDLAKFIAPASHFSYPQESCDDGSWTKSARAIIQRLEENSSFRQAAPEILTHVRSLGERVHLLDTLPAVLTHLNPGSRNLLVDNDTGQLTGVIGFGDARMEAFGINLFAFYESFVGGVEDGRWSPYDMPAGEPYPGLSVSEVLMKAFWVTLRANMVPELECRDFEEAVRVALRVGLICRYFEGDMLDEIDLETPAQVVALYNMKRILLLAEEFKS